MNTLNLTSYAEITKGKISSTNYSNSEQIRSEILNKILQKTIIEFIENNQTIISSIFNTIKKNLSIHNLNVSN